MIVCRETEKESWDYHDAIAAHGDPTAHFLDSDAHAWRGRGDRGAQSRAVGGNIRIVGSPEQVADYILRLHRAGIDGVQVSFYDFAPDLEFFGSMCCRCSARRDCAIDGRGRAGPGRGAGRAAPVHHRAGA